VWDPDRWFASVCTMTSEVSVREKRKQADADVDAGLRKRPPGVCATLTHCVTSLHLD